MRSSSAYTFLSSAGWWNVQYSVTRSWALAANCSVMMGRQPRNFVDRSPTEFEPNRVYSGGTSSVFSLFTFFYFFIWSDDSTKSVGIHTAAFCRSATIKVSLFLIPSAPFPLFVLPFMYLFLTVQRALQHYCHRY